MRRAIDSDHVTRPNRPLPPHPGSVKGGPGRCKRHDQLTLSVIEWRAALIMSRFSFWPLRRRWRGAMSIGVSRYRGVRRARVLIPGSSPRLSPMHLQFAGMRRCWNRCSCFWHCRRLRRGACAAHQSLSVVARPQLRSSEYFAVRIVGIGPFLVEGSVPSVDFAVGLRPVRSVRSGSLCLMPWTERVHEHRRGQKIRCKSAHAQLSCDGPQNASCTIFSAPRRAACWSDTTRAKCSQRTHPESRCGEGAAFLGDLFSWTGRSSYRSRTARFRSRRPRTGGGARGCGRQ